MLELNENGRAYIAGLFDGEGCVCIFTHVKRGAGIPSGLTVNVTQKRTEILFALKKLFGGRVMSAGSKHTPQWRVDGEKAVVFLKSILPYLIIKQREAEAGIKFQETVGTFNKGKRLPQELIERRLTIQSDLLKARMA